MAERLRAMGQERLRQDRERSAQAGSIELDPERRRMLEELGYLTP